MTAPPIDTAESYPFATSSIATETQFYDLSRAWAGDGINEDPHGTGSGQLSVDSGARQVTVAAYYVHVGGAVANQPTNVVVDMPAASSQDRLDRIVTRRDPAADKCVLDVLQGTPGSGTPPSLTQDRSAIWEFSHGVVPVNADASLGSHQSERTFIGPGIRYGRSTFRPPDARTGELFYEYDLDRTVQLVSIDGPWRVVLEDTGWQSVSLRGHWNQRSLRVRKRDGVVNLSGGINRGNEFRFIDQTNFEQCAKISPQFRPSQNVLQTVVCPNMSSHVMQCLVNSAGDVLLDIDGDPLATTAPVNFNMTWFV